MPTIAFFTEEHARETLAFCILASTAWETGMEVLYERCCGIDVYESLVVVCILLEQKHKTQKYLRRFGCTMRDLSDVQHIKAVPGRKTDTMDCLWIAELLRQHR